MEKGLFIVFEGIDGSGKTTQAKMLADKLPSSIYTKEPTDGAVGTILKGILSGDTNITGIDRNKANFSLWLGNLMSQDRYDHLYNLETGIVKQLEEGVNVVCDRYIWSTLAYNACNSYQHIHLQQVNSFFPKPDLTVLLDVPLCIALKRLERRKQESSIYETEIYLKQVKDRYTEIIEKTPRYIQKRILVLDGTDPIDVIQAKIADKVAQNLIYN